MRWRLTLAASLIASLVGAGLSLAIIFSLLGGARPLATSDAGVIGALLIPLFAIVAASVFVYRHTARRRALQALTTAVLTCLFTLTIFIVCSMLFPRRVPVSPSSTPPRIFN